MSARPEVAPAGQHWVAQVDDDARTYDDDPQRPPRLRCGHGEDQVSRAIGEGRGDLGAFNAARHNPCGARPVALIERTRPRCANHLYGRWIKYGVVWQWQLSTTNDREEAA